MKKRYISFLLVLVFILGVMPSDMVFANLQNPITTLWLSDNTSSSPVTTDYQLTLSWSMPTRSTKNDTSSVPESPSDPNSNGGNDLSHVTEGYEIYYKNASNNENYSTQTYKSLEYKDLSYNFKINLLPGSFYVFKVDPFHYGNGGPNMGDPNAVPPILGGKPHYKKNTTGGLDAVRAAMDMTVQASEVLYLTDLRVEAEGLGFGRELTVTWDNPLYYGQELIDEYMIYYAPNISDTDRVPEVNPVVVSKDNPNLIRIEGGKKLQFSFRDDDMAYGIPYAVKVVPTITDSILINNNPMPVNHSPREYRCNNVYLKPPLQVEPLGSESIKIIWDSLSTFPSGEVTRVLIKESGIDPENWKVIGTIGVDAAKNTNFWTTKRPSKDMKYMITIEYKDRITEKTYEIDSHIRIFSPSFEDYWPYRPTIYELVPTILAPYSVDIKFLAFLREPYDEENEKGEPQYKDLYIDKDMTYDIWVTDDISNFEDPAMAPLFEERPAQGFPVSAYEKEPFSKEDPRPVYEITASQYMERDSSGNYNPKNMTSNKVYYFKIIATRTESDDEAIRKSLEALGSVYIPPSGDVSTTPIMISSPPLRIKKNADGVDDITDTSITIEWDTKWIEVYEVNKNRWYSSIGVNKDKQIVFGDLSVPNLLNDISVDSNIMARLRSAINEAGASGDDLDFLATRVMDLKNAKYKIHVVEYEGMISPDNDTYEKYIQNKLLDEPGTENAAGSKWNTQWTEITPEGSGNKNLYYIVSGLKQNTPYVIFLRPYTINASYYPAFVAGTTLEVRPDLDIIPTAPVIEVIPEETTDMSVTVRFTYNDSLEYNLYYSELLSNYPQGDQTIDWAELKKNGTVKKAINKATGREETYMYYTIKNLFPETVYYFWVSASSANVIKISNPTSETTKELTPPNPPRGFGPASPNSLDIYNKENGTDIKKAESDYLTFEWMRDSKDDGDIPASFANGSAEALISQLLPAYYMAKFNDLISNKTYYARAKTILTVTKGANGAEKSYSYTVQLSPDADFTDYVEITIPPLVGEPNSVNILRKESDWTTTYYFFTNPSNEDYASDKNDKHYPLPTNDFEILYNQNTNTLTYRFRSNEKDAQGNNDNQVDQRFISRLLSNPSFVYDIDLSAYGTSDVKIREVIMPYSIYKAFNERKMGLNVIAKNMSVTIKPGNFNTNEVNSIKDFGAASLVKVTITDNVSVPALSNAESYASTPHKVSLSIVTPTHTVNLTNTGTDMDISLKLDHRYQTMDANVGAYVSDANTGGWARLNGSFERLSGTIAVSSKKLANFAVIAKDAPVIFEADSTITNSVYNVTTKLDIKDLPSLNPNDNIHPNQFNLMVLAVFKGDLSVKINDPMTENERNRLGIAGILVTGGNVSREAGINALVRLYENKTKPIRNFMSASQSSFSDISDVSTNYVNSMLKAEEIGMLDRFDNLSPKSNMTFADVFYMLDIIIADAGL